MYLRAVVHVIVCKVSSDVLYVCICLYVYLFVCMYVCAATGHRVCDINHGEKTVWEKEFKITE